MQLTTENYHSTEANREYMSCHQFASWVDCPSREAATQAGTYEAPFNKAFLIGSYVDAAITLGPEALAELVEANAENIVGKRGKYADFVKADEMIARLQRDEMAMRLLTGKPQEIVTGELGGVQWRGAIDVLLDDLDIFVDLKTARSFADGWIEIGTGEGYIKNQKCPWYDVYNYWRQMAVYQHLLTQTHGREFRPCIVAVTKEDPPDIGGWDFTNQDRLRMEVQDIIGLLPLVMKWKTGEIDPPECGTCDYCKERKTLTFREAEDVIGNRRAMPRYWRESDPIGQMIEKGQM